jgi:KEOPS complex subunit Cgi121
MITEKAGSYYLVVQGFRNATVVDPERVLNDLRGIFRAVDVQLLRADRVAGKEHLLFAAKNAVDSFGGKDRRAKHLSMEFLLFASGEHQIVEAIKLLGVTSSTSELVAVGLAETEPEDHLLATKVAQMVNGEPDDSVIDFRDRRKTTNLKKAYKITQKELDSARVPGETEDMVLKRLIIERSAMLALEN